MNKKVKLLSLFWLLLLQVNGVTAQPQKDVTINAWLELGSLKFFPAKKESGVGVNVAVKYQINKLLANLQYHDYVDRELAHGGFELFTDNNHYNAGNLLIGITNKKCRYGHVSVSSGLGIFWGKFNENTIKKFKTIGWPVEAAASLNVFPVVGINLKLFANINSKHSLIGFGMDLQLGKLRKFKLIT